METPIEWAEKNVGELIDDKTDRVRPAAAAKRSKPSTKKAGARKALGRASRRRAKAAGRPFSWKTPSKLVRRFLSLLTKRPPAELWALLDVATDELNRVSRRREILDADGKIEAVQVKRTKSLKIGKIKLEKESRCVSQAMRLLRKMSFEELFATWSDMLEAKSKVISDRLKVNPTLLNVAQAARNDVAVSKIISVVEEFTAPDPSPLPDEIGTVNMFDGRPGMNPAGTMEKPRKLERLSATLDRGRNALEAGLQVEEEEKRRKKEILR